ncbi:MAG: PDDEXK nuclease domain-containing protein, partial [Promicromonosporaceae bacterium]|nr:PDDEXK nuclease domain-containing protein [Promicromonosporaceae bacterium]
SLHRMVKFSQLFGEQKVATLPPQLSWSHIRELLPLKSEEVRLFYAEEVAARNLGVRELRYAISRKAFERREIANSQVPEGSAVPIDVFRDPMLLDMLGLKETYLEADLEAAIMRELEVFLLEAGKGWTFVARQKRMPFGGEDYHLDLLFYSRPLRRLIAVDLKLGKFLPEYKGQMDFYLRWLNKYDRQPGEESPVGLILCTEASRDQIEFLELHMDNILVAEYWTDLPPKNELADRIAGILRVARERVARRAEPTTLPNEPKEPGVIAASLVDYGVNTVEDVVVDARAGCSVVNDENPFGGGQR